MIAYKGFNKDLTCTKGKGTFQYRVGQWYKEEKADCARRGFHCAENPLDCLNYYPNMETSVYYIVIAEGDINEDGYDSKISCTRMKLVKELKKKDFVMHALNYIYTHPYRKDNGKVQREQGVATNGFAIVRGKQPVAAGQIGDVLAFVKEESDRRDVYELGLYEVDGKEIQPNLWYDINGKRVRLDG